MTNTNSSILRGRLCILSTFLLLITLSSCDDKDDKKSDQKFTVTFSTGAGSAIPSQSITSGSKATEPSPAPTRSNYVFEGWYTSAGARFDFNTTITANITLSAKWTAITTITGIVTITYLDITGAVNTPLTAVAPMKAPAEATGRFNVKSGSTLPAGLMLDPITGAISGTPTEPGVLPNVTIEFVGIGSYAGAVETRLTIIVNETRTAVESIAYDDVPGVVGVLLMATATKDPAEATGTFREKQGSILPAGLTLNPSTGAINGAPTVAGTSNVIIEFVGTGAYAGIVEHNVTITIRTAVESIAYSGISGVVGTPLAAMAGPTKVPAEATGTFSVQSGTPLPAGLALDESTGLITGTPTLVGTFNATIKFIGNGGYNGTVEAPVTITIQTTRVNSVSYQDVTVTVANTFTITPTKDPAGATGTFRRSTDLHTLPFWVTLNPTTGVITGTPRDGFDVMNRVVNLEFVGNGGYTGTVKTSFRLEINRTNVRSISYEDAIGFSRSMVMTDTPMKNPAEATGTFNVRSGSTLPSWLTLDGSTGVISGIPPDASLGTTSNIAIEFVGNDGYTGTVETTVSIAIKRRPGLIMYIPSNFRGVVGMPFTSSNPPNRTVAQATGTFAVGMGAGGVDLPEGLSLNPSTGVISGTPTAATETLALVFIDFIGNGDYGGITQTFIGIFIEPSTSK